MRRLLSIRRPLLHCLIAFAGAVWLAGCQLPPRQPAVEIGNRQEQQQWQQLIGLIDERLAVAPLVAQSKWNSGAAIDDPVRERLILNDVARRATEAGLDPALAIRFFQAQFDAGKLVQRRLHAQWRAQQRGPFSPAPDLAREVRPVLDRLTPQLIAALQTLEPMLQRPDADARLAAAAEGWRNADADVRAIALQPLLDARER
jgi:chorismate mutase